MSGLDDDRMKAISRASDCGWEISPRGQDVVFRKGHRQVTAKFNDDYRLVLFLAGGQRGKGGLPGLLRLLGSV